MRSDSLADRVSKLREVTVERGATAPEAATAQALADRLAERLQPARPALIRPQVARYATSARADRRSARSLRFVAFG
ncbi:MAG: hypothetical protein QOE11_2840 [Solirubrobacteraceae bacterium]|jgi:hypothetical protein|nr:hypothetical protein [Solirubrobacteraceae bacterium]